MAEAVRDAAGGDEVIVLGNGYGGFVALQMAIRHPNIAAKLILADCGAAFSESGREAFRNMAAASKAKGLSVITDVAMRRLFAPEFQEKHPDLMRDRREAFLRTDPEVFRAACAALAELDLRPELAQVKIPVLVLVGEHDEATPPPMSRELAAGLPNARLKIIAGCAHVPQLQSPELFLDAIGDFLADVRMRMEPPFGCSISNEFVLRTRSLSLRKPKVLGSKSEARLASCFPTSPRGTHPSSLSICVMTFLMMGVAALGG